MMTEANSKRRTIDLLADAFRAGQVNVRLEKASGGMYRCRLDQPDATLDFSEAYRLEGAFCLVVTGIDVEVEMVAESDLRRSIVYAVGERPLHVFIPSGEYRFFCRFLSPPGDYAARVAFIPMSLFDKAGLGLKKTWDLLRRGPTAIYSALKNLRRTPREGVVGVRAVSAPERPARDVRFSRQIMVPRLGTPAMNVSIIIPTRDRVDLLKPCIDSLQQLSGVVVEIIIVDNGSIRLETLDYLSDLAASRNVRVVRQDIPFNFSRLCNLGAASSDYPALLFLNDDIEAMDGDWLGNMLHFLSDPSVGAVGARLLYPSGDLQHAGIASNLVPGPGHPWRGAEPAVWQSHPLLAEAGEVDAVTGACLLVRRSDFLAVGGFDEAAFAITVNDVDLCLKLRLRGNKIVYAPQATLIHKEGQSRPADDRPEQQARRIGELKAFFVRYPDFARRSCFYPPLLRRDTDKALPID